MIKAIRIDNRQLQITAATTAGARRVAMIDGDGGAWYTDHADGAKILAAFKPGGTYQSGGVNITVLHRTRCYVDIAGHGRRLVREWPTGGEVVLIPVGKKCDAFCFAWNENSK